MVRIVPQIRWFELHQINLQIYFQIISEKYIQDCTICMNKLNFFRANRQIIFFSDQGNDLTFDIQGTNSQPKEFLSREIFNHIQLMVSSQKLSQDNILLVVSEGSSHGTAPKLPPISLVIPRCYTSMFSLLNLFHSGRPLFNS